MTVAQILKNFFVKNKMLTALMSIALMLQVIGTLYVPFLVAGLIDEGIAQKKSSFSDRNWTRNGCGRNFSWDCGDIRELLFC